MPPLQLCFAIHNHQPDGNFGHVFEQAYADCYGPLLAALNASPAFKVALHHTGPLLEWIERERADYFPRMRALVERGQVELLGGGFYEPMLAVLPERDARGQILMMSAYLERHFGKKPRGMWLAERVWEPHLAKLIADCGIEYTLVDDGHFRAAGLSGPLRGWYVTEKAGTPLAIFPIDKTLRDAVPFRAAAECVQLFAELGAQTPAGMSPVVTYGDDGEKFGVWPGTKKWVWEQHWLRDFLHLVADKPDLVVTRHFAEVFDSTPPTARVYLPTASYEEMGEWALPAEAQRSYLTLRQDLQARGELEAARPYVRGGIWQSFFAKYPEANAMHKRMVEVSDTVAAAEARVGADALADARRELYRAQCNCAYWHGLFGGLYLNYLRDTVYRHLITAELDAERVLGRPTPREETRDFDGDLQKEIRLTNADVSVFLKPDQGGAAYEIDFRKKRFNVTNVLGRREEGYHRQMARAAEERAGGGDAGGVKSIHELVALKSAGLETLLHYDRYLRHSFVDHFYAPTVTLDEAAAGTATEVGGFVGARYRVTASSATEVTLEAEAEVAGRRVRLAKTYVLSPARLEARYRISVAGEAPLAAMFAPELNLTLLAGDAADRFYRLADGGALDDRRLVSRGVLPLGAALELVNQWDQFTLRVGATPSVALWRYPLETASQSEGGFERTYQGSVLVAPFAQLPLAGTVQATVYLDLIPHA